MVGVVAYLFVPIDIIPDFLVFFGITDDLIVISAAMWFLGKVVPEKVKNSLPIDPADKAKPAKATRSSSSPELVTPKSSPLKPFVIVLLVGLLIAALGSHPWVHTQLASIGALF